MTDDRRRSIGHAGDITTADTPVPSATSLSEQVTQANHSGRLPVVFIHGLWLLPNSRDRWAALFADAGYAPVSPGWPDDPDTVAALKLQQHNPGVTELAKIPGRGHALTIDSGWRDVADTGSAPLPPISRAHAMAAMTNNPPLRSSDPAEFVIVCT